MNSLWIGIIRVGRIFAYRLAWWLVAACAILVIVLGTLAFEERSGSEHSLSTSIYLAMQLFTLKSGAIDGDVSIMLEIARWLGVGVVFGAVFKGFFTAFENRAEAMIVRGLNDHTIICGAGERGRKLAFDLLRDGCFVVLVDPLEDLDKLIDHHLYPRLFLVNADAADVEILARVNVMACKQMFIVGPSDGVNLDIVSETVAAHERKDRASRMYCYVHLESDELFNLVVDSTPAGHLMEMRLFNLRFNAMRAFVHHTRLDQRVARAADGHFIIVGDSDVVEDVVLMLARTCFPVANEKLPVSLVGHHASARAESFREMYPLVDNLVTLDGIDNHDIGQAVISVIDQVQKPDSVAVIIANESDSGSIQQYLLLQQSGLLEPCQFAIHQTSAQRITQLLDINQPGSQTPEVFGLFDDACDVNTVVQEELDALAIQIHNRYLEHRLSGGAVVGSTPAINRWERLPEQYREISRRQADHIYAKCRLVGATVAEDAGAGEEFSFTEDEIEMLAIIEHRRWCAERYVNGWQYRDSRDDLRKCHPDLVDWANLDEETRDYDREPIRQIPGLLSSVGLTIRR